ncbi:helix-turn-helix domain-containing protein [Arthrospira platensis BEA 1257B]
MTRTAGCCRSWWNYAFRVISL